MREFCTKWWKRIATVDMLFIGVLTLLASLFASWLKQFPGFSLFGALIIALLIGMIIQFPIRSAYVGSNDGRKAGVKDAAGLISNKLLRLGIILLGFKLNLAVLFTQGIKCLPIAAVVVTLTIIVCYAIARKLGVDPMLAILTAGGTGICGAAAVMGLAGSIKVPEDKQDEKDNDVTMAVAIVAIMGTVFALLEIALGPLTGMTKDQLGITAGASLHEIAHAVAGGDAFGAVDIATIACSCLCSRPSSSPSGGRRSIPRFRAPARRPWPSRGSCSASSALRLSAPSYRSSPPSPRSSWTLRTSCSAWPWPRSAST